MSTSPEKPVSQALPVLRGLVPGRGAATLSGPANAEHTGKQREAPLPRSKFERAFIARGAAMQGHVSARWDDWCVDPVAGWFAIGGALAAGVPQVFAAVSTRATARAQREHEKADKEAQREHERRANERAEKVAQIREWRDGLAAASAAFADWQHLRDSYSGRDVIPPRGNVRKPIIDGEAWFLSLRQHLPKMSPGSGASASDPEFYGSGTHIVCDSYATEVLGNEVGRIEREWLE